MNDAQLAAIVIALVGVFRARSAPAAEAAPPGLDDNAVPLVAAVVGGVLSLLHQASLPWLAMAHGVAVGLTGVGAMTVLKYVGERLGTALGRALATTRPTHGEAKGNGGEPKGHEGGLRA